VTDAKATVKTQQVDRAGAARAHLGATGATARAPETEAKELGGVNPELREWWEEHLRFLKLKEDFAANGPGDTSGGVLAWLEAQAAEKAAIDAALAGVTNKLRSSPGAPTKRDRDAEMLKRFNELRPKTPSIVSDSALAEKIGRQQNPPIKRRAAIEAIRRAKKKVRGKRV
jgi:hypothetical protein